MPNVKYVGSLTARSPTPLPQVYINVTFCVNVHAYPSKTAEAVTIIIESNPGAELASSQLNIVQYSAQLLGQNCRKY